MIFLKLRKNLVKAILVTAIAILFMAAVPLTANAEPAFLGITMDRTTITPGQSVTFSVRATQQTNFVFAMVDGTRVQGSRIAGNDWSVTVTPNNTTTVTVFANSSNDQFNNAASISVPVTVTTATTTTTAQTVTHNVQIPVPPADLGPIAIASVTETPATASGEVQLTVVTGIETGEVWVNFDRVNNARATGRFARATMLTQGTNSRTWVVNFRPSAWATQQVEIGSNRTYNWPGAATRIHNLTLTQPFVAPIAPRINTVSINPRTVTGNNTTTFTINTNLDAEHVWVRDVNGREHTAHRTTSTTHARNWQVSFSPGRTGSVTVFANATRTEANAATRTESITVGHGGSASIIGTPTAQQIGGNQTRIHVTTNGTTESVWAIMPGTNHRIALRRTNTGTGNRTWSEDVQNIQEWGNIVIGVSSQSGNINNLSADDSRTISHTSSGTGTGVIHSAVHWSNADREVRRGDTIQFRVTTSDHVTDLAITGANNAIDWTDVTRLSLVSSNVREWRVTIYVTDTAPLGRLEPTLRAFSGNNAMVDSMILPNTTIRNINWN
jgi:hypothetical protein